LRDRTGSAQRASVTRRLFARLRASRAGVLYRRLDGTSEEDGMPWMTRFAGENRDGTEPAGERDVAERFGERQVADRVVGRETAEPAGEHGDPGLVPALHRVADAFERMATSLEVEHREREARLDAVERLLRDLVTGLTPPTSVPPVVIGGSIDLEALHAVRDGAEIDLADPALESTETTETS
jgi:hypothetical protein